MSTEIAKQEKPKSIVAQQLDAQQASLGAEVAMKALKLVQPMIESVSNELESTLGDNETLIVIRRSSLNAPATILMIDTSKDFMICGAQSNHTTSDIERNKYIKQQRDNGLIDDETWSRMNTCDNKSLFRGAINPETRRPYAIKQFYIIRDFVDALLTGRMKDITDKLMK